MQSLFTDMGMFVIDTEACKLVNVFSDKHKLLDGSTQRMIDLLEVGSKNKLA